MAKKKSSPPSDNANDDAATEKFDNLKSLNDLLVKETAKRRQQVDSLTKANTVLESELNLCKLQNVSLSEQAVRLEIEKRVEARVCTVEMAGKFEGLVRDLDLVVKEKSEIESMMNVKELEIGRLKSEFNKKLQVENELWSRVREAEKKEEEVLEEFRRMKADYDRLVNEKGLVVREKDSVEKKLVESNELIDKLKMDVDKVTEEKKLVEGERDSQERERNKLQSVVDGLNASVRKLQEEKTKLVDEVAELEKKSVVSLDNEAKMRTEIDVLVKEKRDVEVDVERLMEEKSLVEKELVDALKSLNIERTQLVDEKQKINVAKNQAESDAIRLKERLEKLNNTVAKLEKLRIDQNDKIKRLESENRHYIAASEQVKKERDNVQASLDGEKQNVKRLTDNVSKIEKDMQKKLSKMQKETQELIAEKKNLENACAMLQKEHDETKGKLQLSQTNTSKILKVLKNTSLICNSKENNNMGADKETNFGEEIKPHIKEVEAIKKAFKDKESVVDEMKQQLELLKVRVAKAEKGKSFWTTVSSATTVLAGAAVSLAYVAWVGN